MLAMPRPALTSSFAVDASEVVCPLQNNDGSNCRKRCLGEKRFRSMQEHIRRAHPAHYIPKLPATEESFMLMVSSRHDQRARDAVDASPRAVDDAHPAATAAVALAQLHHHRLASDWDDDASPVELPPLRDHFKPDRALLPSILAHSPPPRSSTLPPIQRDRFARPRRASVSQNARRPRLDRPAAARRPSLGERKALSAEPQTAAWAQGKRWEDLIEAATSATDGDDDRSEVAPSPSLPPLIANITSAPLDGSHRASLPPLQPPSSAPRSLFDSRRRGDSDLEPFPSIESSLDSASSASGKPFPVSRNLAPSGPGDSSPLNRYPYQQQQQQQQQRFPSRRDVQVYCACCSRPRALDDCLACCECICAVCRDCVGLFAASPRPGLLPGPTSHPQGLRGCPRCRAVGGKWRAFQLDFR